jgi:precorrin-2 dehydrogenase/sirohydrochlorin ferrochelatase
MSNFLFPVFLKLEKLNLLIIGGGAVGLEKLNAVINNSPACNITLVAPRIREEIVKLAQQHSNLKLLHKSYSEEDQIGHDLIIAATGIRDLNRKIWEDAKRNKILINVADTPDLCDFYLSSIVKKGDLKIAISTNGKSPTFAKRLKEFFEFVLPEGLDDVLDKLNKIREKLKGDFEYKVKKLNEITSVFKEDEKK